MEPDGVPETTLQALSSQVSRMAQDLPGPLRRVRVHAGDATVEVEWQPATEVAARPAAEQVAVVPAAPAVDEREAVLASPMVGTFYRAPAPTEPPFVEVGDVVEEGRTVGVIEAMKLFNPITAELSGVVKEILVGDVEPVEFGQPLIRLAVGGDGSGAG